MKIKRINRKKLLELPFRKDGKVGRLYNWVLVVPTGRKHDSGYMLMAIIGCWVDEYGQEKMEICVYPDDIHWLLPDSQRNGYKVAQLRTDCFYPSGVLQFWGRGKFKVDDSSLSAEIEFICNHNE